MSPTAIVQVLGVDVVERELYFVGDAALNLRAVFEKQVKPYLEQSVREQFSSEGSRGGAPWDQLENKYMFAKWKRGERLEILRAKDVMYQELTGGSGSGQNTTIYDEWMTFGSSTEEFSFQQGNTGTGDMPVRLPVVVTAVDQRVITGMIMDSIISGSGFYSDMSRSPKTGRKYYSNRGANGQFVARGA